MAHSQRKDTRIAYGATCLWWDTIDKVGTNGKGPIGGLPCCPICKGVLFEVSSMQEWDAGITKYAIKNSDTTYPAFMQWLRGKCRPRYDEAREEYAEYVDQQRSNEP